jgi:hypothetical protein
MKSHAAVIENFVKEGSYGKGNSVIADARNHAVYSVYRNGGPNRPDKVPLAVELQSGAFLANGAGLWWPLRNYQNKILQVMEESLVSFGVVPFDSITAAMTNGKVRDWRYAPFKLGELRREVDIAIPSQGEKWKEVKVRDKYGREETKQVHTLGDSVIRVRESYYLSGVDETGWYRGIFFLAKLATREKPRSYEEAMSMLKPKAVLDAEARGRYVRRQGEWFAVGQKVLTSQLMADVGRGVAVYKTGHVLGRGGHHKLEEAVIYRAGPQKGEVYARGKMVHTRNEHVPLELGFRWHQIIHNIQDASYSMAGNFD